MGVGQGLLGFSTLYCRMKLNLNAGAFALGGPCGSTVTWAGAPVNPIGTRIPFLVPHRIWGLSNQIDSPWIKGGQSGDVPTGVVTNILEMGVPVRRGVGGIGVNVFCGGDGVFVVGIRNGVKVGVGDGTRVATVDVFGGCGVMVATLCAPGAWGVAGGSVVDGGLDC